MKQKKSLILLTACLMLVGCLNAQHPTRHFISLTGGVGYVNTIRPNPALPFQGLGGVGENIGVGYQLHHNHLTFGVGVEFGNSMSCNVSQEDIIPSMHGIPLLGVIEKGMTELLYNINVNIPIMLGGEFGKFYFKAGLVPAFSVYGKGAVIGPAFNENSVVWDKEDIQYYRYTRIPQVYGRFEIGGSFGSFTSFDDPNQPRARFYLGAYADCGLMKDKPKQGIGVYPDVPYAISYESSNDVSIPINVGLRFTCLLNVGK
jgi:hypothetical protein